VIRHLVFDLGNVLARFAPREFVPLEVPDPAAADALYHALFETDLWYRLDEGTLDDAGALEEIDRQLPQYRHLAARLLAVWDKYLVPIPEMEPLLRQLKAGGYQLYLLSNASKRFYQYRSQLPALRLLDGFVISADYRVAKPQARIYEILCERYGLQPEQCFFTDDLPQNVQAAREAGWQAEVFTSPEAYRALLIQKGIL
jgi:putative hydrolase of the HAD superfamily